MRIRNPGRGTRPGTVPGRLPRWLSFGVAPFAFSLVISLALTAYADAHSGGTNGVSPASGPSRKLSLAQLMNLAPVLPRRAPDFVLTDQRGQRVRLASFRGKAVLLGFYDPHCTQACPVVAQMLLAAQKDLGPYAARVVFVGVNVNPGAESVAAIRHFTKVHGLTRLPDWYFLTGSTAALAAVWRNYEISVSQAPGATQTVHSDYLYFLSPLGTERYLAQPLTRERKGVGYLPGGTIARWGHGIAQYLKLAGSS